MKQKCWAQNMIKKSIKTQSVTTLAQNLTTCYTLCQLFIYSLMLKPKYLMKLKK